MINVIVKLPDGKILHHALKHRNQIQYYDHLIGVLDEGKNTMLWVSPENIAFVEELEDKK